MDWKRMLELAGELAVPGLVARGVKIASDAAEFAKLVKVNADRAGVVLSSGDQAMLDAIHAEALAANDGLDAKLAAAEKR